jgi:hypothetical protein
MFLCLLVTKFYVISSCVFSSSNLTHCGFPVRGIFQERNEGLPLLKSECVESDDVVALASDCIQNSHS